MFKNLKYLLLTLALLLAFVTASSAQQPAPSPAQTQPDSPIERGFKSRVFEVKYRDPNSLLNAIYHLGSGFKGSAMSANSEFRTLTVRDFPENIATVDEALKRLDVPSAPRPSIEMHMHVLIASNAGGAATEAPAELKDVLTQLRGTLNYRTYDLAASIVQRLTETPRGLSGSGIAELPPGTPNSSMPYEYYINNVSLVPNATGAASVQIAEFTFVTIEKERAKINTALTMRDGEKVVVGTATLRNRALVIVLTAKLIK